MSVLLPSSPLSKDEISIKPEEMRRRVLMRHLTSPLTLAPFLAGVTTLAGLWAFSMRSGLAVFGGVALLLGAAGSFLTQALLGSERVARRVMNDLRKEAESRREKTLDDLDRRLIADGDPRTEANLRDLRVLSKAFREDRSWPRGLNTQTTFDILGGVDLLFERCVLSLERSLELYRTARMIRTRATREQILRQRENVVQDVARSIEQLGTILGKVHAIEAGDEGENTALSGIRDELDRSLEVAQSVERRVRELDQEIGLRQ
jgi:hypothetical protein